MSGELCRIMLYNGRHHDCLKLLEKSFMTLFNETSPSPLLAAQTDGMHMFMLISCIRLYPFLCCV